MSRVESFPRAHHHIVIKSYKMMVNDSVLGWYPMFDAGDKPEDGEDQRFFVRPKVLYLSVQLLRTWDWAITLQNPTAD